MTRHARRVMHVVSWRVVSCAKMRDEHVALVVCVAVVSLCLFQNGGRRRSSARLYKVSLLCSGFASISETTTGKKWGGHVNPSPRCGDAPKHVSCVSHLLHASRYASRSSRDVHHDVLPDKRDTAHHWL